MTASMPTYQGSLRITAISTQVHVDGGTAEVSAEYRCHNPGHAPLRAELGCSRGGLESLTLRAGEIVPEVVRVPGLRPVVRPDVLRPVGRLRPEVLRPTVNVRPDVLRPAAGVARPTRAEPMMRPSTSRIGGSILKAIRKAAALDLRPKESVVADLRYSVSVRGERTKSLQLIPSLEVDGDIMLAPVAEQRVTVELPASAKQIVSSSVPPAKVTRTDAGLVVEFALTDAPPVPLTLKWTELDVGVRVRKSTRVLSGRRVEVTITVQNTGAAATGPLEIRDEYSAGDLESFEPAGHFLVGGVGDRETRVTFRADASLAPGKSVSHVYTVTPRGGALTVPTARVTSGGVLVAISGRPQVVDLGPIVVLPTRAAVAVPSGFSFDYVDDDHHLKNFGILCVGGGYDAGAERLRFTDSVVYADINGDDDYDWSAMHHVLRFGNAFTCQETTPWLAKTGNVTVHSDSFRHEDLRRFSKVVVLLAGWQFDFTNDDHHINKAAIEIVQKGFDRAEGVVRWETRVTYADQNFDDPYRFRYSYIILGFNGTALERVYSAPDGGGSAAAIEQVTDATLKAYPAALVVPTGWSFDFKSDDHHVNVVSFGLRNVAFNQAAGRVTWNAHADFRDKNADDDYTWGYRALILGCSDGEQREHETGSIRDDGGAAARAFDLDLRQLFRPITWQNGVRDGDETGVDCGGSSPADDLQPVASTVNPGTADSSSLYSLRDEDEQRVVRTFATVALLEYAQSQGADMATFYGDHRRADRYVEAVAWYVDQHMEYVSDGGSWSGSQSAYETLTASGHRGSKDFAGDCEDHAILRAALLRALGFKPSCIYCADHHNGTDQGQDEECSGDKKSSGGHTYNVVVYRGKYRILDYGVMQRRVWANKRAWNQHVTDNIWNDHTGQHWSRQDTSPSGSVPLVNYPGNPCCPSTTWDWRTYFDDITL